MVNESKQYFMFEKSYYSISWDGWAKLIGYVRHHQKVERDWLAVCGARQLSWVPKNRAFTPILDYPIIWRSDPDEKN